MTIKSIVKHERKNVQKFLRFQLPNSFKKIGWLLFISAFAALILFKILVADAALQDTLKSIAKYGLLVGLLIVSLSKEPIEDELVQNMRMQSYMLAFLIGVLSAFVVPLINFGAETLVDGTSVLQGVGDFVLIWTLLFCQIGYFSLLKRINND